MNTAFDGTWSTLWFRWMTAMSWQVAVLVAVLFAIGWLLQRQSARLRYSLWSLVLVRLVLPPTLALATGWAWWVLPVQEVPRTLLVEARPPDASVIPLPIFSNQFGSESTPLSITAQTTSVAPKPAASQQTRPTPSPARSWKVWLLCSWFLGTAVMTVRLIRGLSQALHLTRSSTLIHDPGLNQLLLDCCQRVGVRTSIRLQESSLIDTPLLIGIWRPTILVPFKIQEHLSLAELESVLIHELHHVRRHDAAVSLLQAVLKAVYFFHPGVWVADRWLRRLREEACDEATVGVLNGNRRNYSSAILKLAEQTLRPAPPLAIGVVDSGSHITHRMRRILDPKLPTGQKLSWSALAFVLIAAATLLPAGPQKKVLIQNPQEADAGIKPVEFRIVPTTLPQDQTQIRWLPIRQQPVSKKDSGLPPTITHARQVNGRWEAPVWDVAEHALLASDKWHVVECDAKQDADNSMARTLTITLDEQGGNAFRTLSMKHLHQNLAIIVNGKIISTPTINHEMGSRLEISGGFTKESAQALADAISQPAKTPEPKASLGISAAFAPPGEPPETTSSPTKPTPSAEPHTTDADEKTAASVPAKPGQGAATGRVLRADTKQPIAEVEVRLVKKPDEYWVYPLEPKRVKSNAAGEYRFEDLPPGEYRVYAFHDRLASRTQQVRFDNVTIDAEGNSTPVDLFMADGLNMNVRVISKATGEPIPNAAVRLRWTDNDDNAQTDEQGEVLISCLTRGEQHVEATAAGYSQAYLRQQLEAPMTEITLELPPGETMQGQVTDEAGNPIAGVEVSATPNRGMTNFDKVTTDDQGRFTLQHLSLTNEFHISASKKDWDYYFEPLSLQGGVPQSFIIRIRPRPSGGDVNVLIVDQAGKPIVGAEASNHGLSSAHVLSEKSDDAGRLTLRHLYLRSRSQPDLVIRAAGFAPQLVSVPPAQPNTPAEFRVALEPGSRVRGRVLSTKGEPIPHAWVYFSDGNYGTGSGIGGKLVADSEGRFSSNSLPPNCPFTIQGQGFTERTNVKLPLNTPDEVTITLEPVGAFSGLVVDGKSGTAVKTFNVKLAFATQVPAGAQASQGMNADWVDTGKTFTDTAGRFEWPDLPIDTAFDWIISAKGYETQRVVGQRSLAAPQEVRVELKSLK